MSKLIERIGRSINELDIDFSRFSVAGWCVSAASLTIGFVAALAAYCAVVGKIRDDRGPALVFGLVMIGTTVAAFLLLRGALSSLGISIVRSRTAEDGHLLK